MLKPTFWSPSGLKTARFGLAHWGLVLSVGWALNGGLLPASAHAAAHSAATSAATSANNASGHSAAAASALKSLLGPSIVLQAGGGAPMVVAGLDRTGRNASGPALTAGMAGTAGTAGTTTTVQRGETLDRVIRRTLPHVPLQLDFLRKAFVSLNPQAFPTGSVHLMRAGSTLQVPSMAVLRQMLVQQNPATAAFFAPDPSAPGHHSAHDTRRWVRFP